MPVMTFRFVCFVILCSMCNSLLADANKGELLGYEIGTIFEFDNESPPEGYRSDAFVVKSTNQDFDEVYLELTSVSYMITKITGRIRVRGLAEAEGVLNRYKSILKEKYPDWKLICNPRRVELRNYDVEPSRFGLTADMCVFSGGEPGYYLSLVIDHVFDFTNP